MDTPTRIGRYEIIEELGRGAMGVVYRAKDPAMGRVVALKTIISVALEGSRGAEFRERFFREARAAGGLSHPGIVAMFDVGEHDGQPYMVMEFVSGPTLSQYARQRERLTVDRICELGAQIAQALSFAHARGVVHRDIKPANILITSGEAHGIERAKITDFGVAKLAEQHTTMTGQMVGTPAYMPPEQFTGAAIDGRSDIFSLGVILYWLSTGEQPFAGESITSISYKVVNADPIPPRRINPALPARFDAVVMKCLAKSPEERYQSGDELARDLAGVRKPGATQISGAVPAFDDADATLVALPDGDAAVAFPAGPPVAAGTAPTAPGPAPTAATGATTLSPAAAAPARLVPLAAPAAQKPGSLKWIAALLVVALAVAGWFGLRSPSPGAAEESPAAAVLPDSAGALATPSVPSSGPAAAPQSAASSRTTTPTPTPAAADAGAKLASTTSSVDAAPRPVVEKMAAEPPPTPKLLSVDFDPKALDRRTNARVELDVSRMPGTLEFALQMNDRIYFEKTGGTPYKKEGELYVPPGVHEFRVVARDGAVEKISNTVSMDFKANKRSTLKIELRIAGKPAEAGMPNGLYPDSQLVLTLR